MKKRWYTLCLAIALVSGLSGCGNTDSTGSDENADNQSTLETEVILNTDENTENTETAENIETAETAENTEATGNTENGTAETDTTKILVAYFTRLSNTVSGDDLDAVVQGGGPYGAIGDSFETADMDAISSASITVTDEGVKGNVETVAEWIAKYTQADLFSIETAEKYPLDYDTLIDQGGEEQQASTRPELATYLENLEKYSVIYLGFPNWYYDMPMAMYSFLEEYDLADKTIVPFTTSAGSGFSNTISSIAELQPEADVIENGLSLRMGEVRNSEQTVRDWIDQLDIKP